MLISEIEQTFKEIFEEEEGKVRSVETTYEKVKDENFLKLIISIHGLSVNDTLIIHTKFIFKVNLEKSQTIEDSFIYLYNINCIYHKVDFKDKSGLRKKVEDIIESNKFGESILILSDFIESPCSFLNYYLKKEKITDYSIFDVKYDPKFKITKCSDLTFDFDININNNYTIKLTIKKTDKDPKDLESKDNFSFLFSLLDKKEKFDSDTLKNIHFLIGSGISTILDSIK